MPRAPRDVLLRVANIDPAGMTTPADRMRYSAIGFFMLLYLVSATLGGAALVDAAMDRASPWYGWLIGPLVAAGVILHDRAVVGRVVSGAEKPGPSDPVRRLRKPVIGRYAGRLGLALLFAALITEPLMLARYQSEIDARLTEVHHQQLSRVDRTGAVSSWTARLGRLDREAARDDDAVAALRSRAEQKRQDARKLSRPARDGLTRAAGCLASGSCDQLVRRTRALDDEAAALDMRAGRLLDSQREARQARAEERADLTRQIRRQSEARAEAAEADSGFGARTAALGHLVTSDFRGAGVSYLGLIVLLMALDCAALVLTFASRRNGRERDEARRRGHQAMLVHVGEIQDAGTVMTRVADDDEDAGNDSAERAGAVARTSVFVPAEVSELTALPGRQHRSVHAELLGSHPAAADPGS